LNGFDREADVRITLLLSFIGLFTAVMLAALPESTVEHGKEVYAVQKCALCHSIAGIGGKKPALDGVGSKLKSDDIKKWIRTPKEMKANTTMKPYPNLPEKDLNDLTAYLSTLR
jgi:mono/diheme cytochrome c family protein